MQSDGNSLKPDTIHKAATYEPHDYTSYEKITTYARHEYGQVRIKMRSLVQKL